MKCDFFLGVEERYGATSCDIGEVVSPLSCRRISRVWNSGPSQIWQTRSLAVAARRNGGTQRLRASRRVSCLEPSIRLKLTRSRAPCHPESKKYRRHKHASRDSRAHFLRRHFWENRLAPCE